MKAAVLSRSVATAASWGAAGASSRDAPPRRDAGTVVLVFTQVWGYAKVWVLGRFWLRLGPRFGGAADPGFTPRSRGFGATLKTPLGLTFFIYLFSPPLSRPLAIEPPTLELQRGELAVVVSRRARRRGAHRAPTHRRRRSRSRRSWPRREATCKSRSLPGRWSEPGITRCAQARAERRARL